MPLVPTEVITVPGKRCQIHIYDTENGFFHRLYLTEEICSAWQYYSNPAIIIAKNSEGCVEYIEIGVTEFFTTSHTIVTAEEFAEMQFKPFVFELPCT